ncbi:hypothetical protein NON00_17450 [Roseomonas sp. GC11]|uniref:hypothetical protein n=1 Tax=Roseomonas sp. GC11 TaxID=2950546 RepID=UPI00210A5217|nr:hypothetical protein [Roseomonas sp. GC11]MCQ4161703.1 hypothetical protein [Roseomonas sp. GC11]
MTLTQVLDASALIVLGGQAVWIGLLYRRMGRLRAALDSAGPVIGQLDEAARRLDASAGGIVQKVKEGISEVDSKIGACRKLAQDLNSASRQAEEVATRLDQALRQNRKLQQARAAAPPREIVEPLGLADRLSSGRAAAPALPLLAEPAHDPMAEALPTLRETFPREPSRRDPGLRMAPEISHRDLSHREMSHREMPHRESAYREPPPRDLPPRALAQEDDPLPSPLAERLRASLPNRLPERAERVAEERPRPLPPLAPAAPPMATPAVSAEAPALPAAFAPAPAPLPEPPAFPPPATLTEPPLGSVLAAELLFAGRAAAQAPDQRTIRVKLD